MSRHHFEDDERYVVIDRGSSSGVGALFLGIAIGAGVALLFAPQSGADTRREIKRRALRAKRAARRTVTGVTDTVTGTFEDARRRVEERIDSVRGEIDLKKKQVHMAMDAGRAAARDARRDIEDRIAETKAAYEAGAAVARKP